MCDINYINIIIKREVMSRVYDRPAVGTLIRYNIKTIYNIPGNYRKQKLLKSVGSV